jgi:hypothetical protein
MPDAGGMIETRREGRYKFHYSNTASLARLADLPLARRKGET